MTNKQNKNKYQRVVVDGVTFKINPEVLDDIEIIEQLSTVTDGTDPFSIVKVMKQVLGETGYQRAKDHCRNKQTGRTPASKLSEFFGQIMQAAAPNSSSSQHS